MLQRAKPSGVFPIEAPAPLSIPAVMLVEQRGLLELENLRCLAVAPLGQPSGHRIPPFLTARAERCVPRQQHPPPSANLNYLWQTLDRLFATVPDEKSWLIAAAFSDERNALPFRETQCARENGVICRLYIAYKPCAQFRAICAVRRSAKLRR